MVSEASNIDYYARREQSERELAERAADPHVANIHRELADRYADYVRSQQRPNLRLVVPQ